ncbi:DUF3024 domain-containing protein [Myroides injenensis]|uniref:DUF3024 domain-containing protein n=1 Tax=Myroides injenensis TaxID=1183151 RepID=UPI000288D29B|nr:DUF3024 domain-containing protein [Myroides injenensis]
MGITVNFFEQIVSNFIEEIRPQDVEFRKIIDFEFTSKNNVFELYCVRPAFFDPSLVIRLPYAKFKYVKTQNIWKLYWKLANGKWTSYDKLPESDDLLVILNEIKEDPLGCFMK